MLPPLRILFLGTPDFAAASLKALIQDGQNIVAVVTAPDKPAGRGLQLQESAVKKVALSHQLKVLQPEKLKEEKFLEELRSLNIDLGIVVAFRMMPQVLWSLPKWGTFNLHASLLPQYRGAAPIHWAVIHGEKETGVTTFFLKHEIDTGDIILQEKTSIGENETTGELYGRLMIQGAALVVKTVQLIQSENYSQIPQKVFAETKTAPKIFKETAEINFNQPIQSIYNLIRGMTPVPGAWWIHLGKKITITQCRMNLCPHQQNPGFINTDGKSFAHVYGTDGYINLLRIKAEGKKEMSIIEYLNGSKF